MVDLLLERGFAVRVIDSLVDGRERNLEHHRDNADLACEWRDIRGVRE
ncbi:MAG: NAD-dependent dehydratase, partial [Alphaproteobacteria bacterium]|nr:NAD-dependent dehydratase [Alphaproteobacteria bacterium]